MCILYSGFKPETPVRLTNCGHFFCYDCINSETKCVKCDIPVQPSEIKPDTLIINLIQNCDIIAEVINKRFDWIFLSTRYDIRI